MGREDPVSDAAEQASTVDTGGAGSDQLVVLEAASAQEVVTATRKNTRRMIRAEMMIPKGSELKNPKDSNVAGKRTNGSGANGDRAPTRARR